MGRKGWTKEEIDIVRNYYPSEGIGVAARLEGRTENQIYGVAWHYGIKNESRKKRECNTFPSRKYSNEDIMYILEHIDTDGAEAVAVKLGRTVSAVRSVASKARQSRRGNGQYAWSEDEIRIVRKFFPIEGINVRDRLKGRSDAAIYSEASHLGVARNKRTRRSSNSAWTKDEDDIIRKYYEKEGADRCRKELPLRSRQAIIVRANRYLGIKRNRSGSAPE